MNRWSLLGDGFAGLWRWLRRRPLGENEFAYHRRSQLIAFLVLLVFTLPVEILLVELLVPWDVVRWILLLAAVAGTLWAIGVILSIRTFPHRLMGDELELRYGALGAAVLPIHEISSVELARGTPPRGEGVFVDLETATGWIAAGGQTALTLRLREPISVWDGWTARGPVGVVHVAADDPAALEAAIRGQMRISPP